MKKGRKAKSLSGLSQKSRTRAKQKSIYVNELKRLVELTNVSFEGAHFGAGIGKDRARSATSRVQSVTVGEFRGSKHGYGFVERESGRDVFIPQDKTLGAMDGDRVEVLYHSFTDRFGEEKTEGRVVKIISEGRKSLIGTLCRVRTGYGKRSTYSYVLVPDNARFAERIDVVDTSYAKDGDKVEAKIIRRSGYVECSVVRVFGDAESFGANYSAVLAECGIDVEFEPDAIELAKKVSRECVSTDGRVDLRDEIIFTIDGAGAKDLDDAISLRRVAGGGWRLGVHIADVSHYVGEKTSLDRAVMARGTSVYFTDKVVPMLPPELSNGACSLNCGEDKYAISAIIRLDDGAEIVSVDIKPSVIRSCVRGVYSEVNSIFEDKATPEIKQKYKRAIPTLMKMHELYLKLCEKSHKRGALELSGSEAYIILNESGHPTDIVRAERGDGEKMIEQFMLTANEAVATKLHTLGIPCVYRVHEPPPEEKLDSLITFLSNLGFDTRGIRRGDSVDLHALGALLGIAEQRGIEAPVSYAILRSMSKAKYSEVNGAHFGLGISLYCHFTSPIRRLSDLATHRIIRRVLFEDKKSAYYLSYAKRAAAAASDAELRAMSAQRKIDDMYKALYLSDRIGEEFFATVSSVTSFGLFCELENTCEGLVPISDLGGDFVFDEKNLTLRSAKAVYRLGDTVRVRVEECDVNEGKVRFSVL